MNNCIFGFMKPIVPFIVSIIVAVIIAVVIIVNRHTLHLLQDTVGLICLGLVELVSISTTLYENRKENECFLGVSGKTHFSLIMNISIPLMDEC
ncbi:MAG: hypothetical protein ACLPY5_08405 [Candidatus Bathyarchaeia archaeon]